MGLDTRKPDIATCKQQSTDQPAQSDQGLWYLVSWKYSIPTGYYMQNFSIPACLCGSAGCSVPCLVGNPEDGVSRIITHVIKGQFYKRIIGKWPWNAHKKWLFSYNSFVKFHGNKIWEPQHLFVYLFGLMLYVPVNSYDHVRTVSSPYHTFFHGQAWLSD